MEKSKYIAKLKKQYDDVSSRMDKLYILSKDLRMKINYMEALGEDQGRLLEFILCNQEQDPEYWEDTISKVCTLKTEDIAKEVGISPKRIEKAFDDDTRKSSITILGASPTRKALERLYIFENLFK